MLELFALCTLKSVWFLSWWDILVPISSVDIKTHTLMGHFKSQYDVFNKKHTLWWDIPNQWQNQKHPIPILWYEVYQSECCTIDVIYQLLRTFLNGTSSRANNAPQKYCYSLYKADVNWMSVCTKEMHLEIPTEVVK